LAASEQEQVMDFALKTQSNNSFNQTALSVLLINLVACAHVEYYRRAAG
jgi:hypothetical protein